jgi:hypothetical protein
VIDIKIGDVGNAAQRKEEKEGFTITGTNTPTYAGKKQ